MKMSLKVFIRQAKTEIQVFIFYEYNESSQLTVKDINFLRFYSYTIPIMRRMG